MTFGDSIYRCGNYSRAETICGNTIIVDVKADDKVNDKVDGKVEDKAHPWPE